MNHGDHGGHKMPGHDMPGGHDMPMDGGMCSMNMLFNWDVENVCVVFKSWKIQSNFQLLLSMLAIILIGIGYEYLRIVIARGYDAKIAAAMSPRRVSSSDSSGDDEINALLSNSRYGKGQLGTRVQLTRAILYALTSGISLFIMLIFMTFNAYLMLAVVVGAGLGFFLFDGPPTSGVSSKAGMCH